MNLSNDVDGREGLGDRAEGRERSFNTREMFKHKTPHSNKVSQSLEATAALGNATAGFATATGTSSENAGMNAKKKLLVALAVVTTLAVICTAGVGGVFVYLQYFAASKITVTTTTTTTTTRTQFASKVTASTAKITTTLCSDKKNVQRWKFNVFF
jgi:cell division septal protein FtsQ